MSLMLITHDLAVLAGLSSAIAVMKDGQIVETGETTAPCSGRTATPIRPGCLPPPATPGRCAGAGCRHPLLRSRLFMSAIAGRPACSARRPMTEAVRSVSLVHR